MIGFHGSNVPWQRHRRQNVAAKTSEGKTVWEEKPFPHRWAAYREEKSGSQGPSTQQRIEVQGRPGSGLA